MSIRPQYISELSSTKFNRLTLASSANTGYVFKGNRDYSFSCGIRAKEVIQAQIQKKWCSFFRNFAVLDIGTGGGQFLEGMPRGVKAYGITATNMRPIPPDPYYRICNAENLLEEFSPKSFDLIFSHLAFVHMVDPLKALKESYIALKPGGFLILDRFQLKGVHTEEWVARMQGSGYEIASVPTYSRDGEKSGFEMLVIRKTNTVFDTQILYNTLEKEKCRYRLIDSEGPPTSKNPSAFGYLSRSGIDRTYAYQRDQEECGSPLPEEDFKLLQEEDLASEQSIRRAQEQLDEWDLPYTI
jgi:SAM-dependent methyltransferase